MPKDLNQDRQQIHGYSPNQIIFPITSSITGNPQGHILQGPQQIQNYSVAPQMFTQSMIGTQGVPRGIAPHQQNIVFPQTSQPFVPRQPWRGNNPNVQHGDIQNGFAPQFVNQQGYQVIQSPYIRYPAQQQYPNQPVFIVSTPAPPHQGYQSIQPIQPQAQQQQVHDSQAQQNVHIQQQQYIQSQAQVVQPQYQPQSRKIKIVDPNSGKDITSDIIVKKKEKNPHGQPQQSGISAEEQEKLNKKAKIAAQFAAQVAAAAASSPSPSPAAQPAPIETSSKAQVVAVASKDADSKSATIPSSKNTEVEGVQGKDHQEPVSTQENDVECKQSSTKEDIDTAVVSENQDAIHVSNISESSDQTNAEISSATQVSEEGENVPEKQSSSTDDAVNIPDVSISEKEIKKEKDADKTEEILPTAPSVDPTTSLNVTETASPIEEVASDTKEKSAETIPENESQQAIVEVVSSAEVNAPLQDKEPFQDNKPIEQCTLPMEVSTEPAAAEVTAPQEQIVETDITIAQSNPVETKPDIVIPPAKEIVEPVDSKSDFVEIMDNKEIEIAESSEENTDKPTEQNLSEMPSENSSSDSAIENAQVEEKKEAPIEGVMNGHDESVKNSGNPAGSAFSQVPKKKTKKQRMRDIQEKENAASGSNDLLSAFVDKPVVEEVSPEEPAVKEPEKSTEDETWEEKEKTIEKEVITNADVEEREIIPKMPQTTILQTSADTVERSGDEKLQYDRDFLLKFQFSPICTAKPDGLPNIEIVLDRAHAGTKALDQGQRMSGNDFMPTFMRSQSGGRQSGGQRSKGGDRRGGPDDRRGPGGQQTPRKIITVPSMQEKVELKKSDNAWVRPDKLAASMDEETKALDEVKRNVRSILNKLTPQKFQTLVSKMVELKIDNQTKLESAIELIFEKAISEPGFSVAYANMCRVLTDAYKVPGNQTKDGGKPGGTVTFRKILLNKCQKEFESESTSEKQIEADKEIHFDSEEKEKAWKEEIAHREWLNRKRTLGNIRFIGELFKLKMISENIMHDCIVKLLRSGPKSEGVQNEDSLECLCQLLTTIGKDLDHEKAKPRMDQYFVQMDKIIRTKKISSRIKFAIVDVIDLRKAGWKSRKNDDNPKTIDQIHKEAAQEEKDAMARVKQNEMKQRLDPQQGRRGPGGRDSPRGPPQAGGDNNTWQSVPAKGRSVPSAPVDASKFRLTKKTDSENISLGPGGFRPSAWAQGASGGSSRPGSGSNTPTSEMDTKATNRFSALSDSNVSSFDAKARGGRGSQQGGRRGTPQTMRRGDSRDDRNDRTADRTAALRAVQDIVKTNNPGMGGGAAGSRGGSRGGSRNQSPARAPVSKPVSAPASGPATPAAPSPPVVNVSREQVQKTAKATVEEYFGVRDLKGAAEYVTELQAPHMHNVFVEEAFNVVIEKKQSSTRTDVGILINYLLKNKITSIDEVVKGISSVTEFATDIAIDIPHIYKYLGEIIGPIVYDGSLPLNKVKDSIECLISENKAGLVMAETLAEAVKMGKTEDTIAQLWASSGLTWKSLLAEGADVNGFVQDKKMGFTMRSPSSATAPQMPPVSHASSVQAELHKLLKDKADNNSVFSFIENKIAKADQCSTNFIKDLSYAVCESAVKDKCQCDQKLLENRSSILLKFIDTNKTLESQALFSIVKLANDLNHPKDLLRTISEILWNTKVISEETFYAWEKSSDFQEGKGVALSSLKGFISSLRDGEDDDDEELSQPSTST